jgi:hypothetical protein
LRAAKNEIPIAIIEKIGATIAEVTVAFFNGFHISKNYEAWT